MLIAFIVVIFVAGLVLAAYSVKMAVRLSCPTCIHEGAENPVIPIGGPFYWLCLECHETFGYREAQRVLDYEREEQEQLARSSRPAVSQRAETYQADDEVYDLPTPRRAQTGDDEWGGF